MRSSDITQALDGVGRTWTRQVKAEEKRPAARAYRETMYAPARTSLKDICYEHIEQAWDKASDGGRLPTHWRQVFYVMRPLCNEHPESDRVLIDSTFKNILEDYLRDYEPGWDVLRGARGVFKEPHAAENDNGLAMSTMNVRNYIEQAEYDPDPSIPLVSTRYPTTGPTHRIAAILICEKEGFDELLQAENVPARYDLGLMSTKGISAIAARDLAEYAEGLDVPCFTLHDLDKNGFVMAGGFPCAVDIGIRMEDVEEWGLAAEGQHHKNPEKTYANVIRNGGTEQEADFISQGQRVELNMLTGPQFVEFVERKLDEHGVKKVIPDEETLALAWRRAREARRANRLIQGDGESNGEGAIPDPPKNLAAQIRQALKRHPTAAWDDAIGQIVEANEEENA